MIGGQLLHGLAGHRDSNTIWYPGRILDLDLDPGPDNTMTNFLCTSLNQPLPRCLLTPYG